MELKCLNGCKIVTVSLVDQQHATVLRSLIPAATCVSTDEPDQQKMVKVEAKKAPNVVRVGGERRGKVPPLKPAKSRTIRSTKTAHGKGREGRNLFGVS